MPKDIKTIVDNFPMKICMLHDYMCEKGFKPALKCKDFQKMIKDIYWDLQTVIASFSPSNVSDMFDTGRRDFEITNRNTSFVASMYQKLDLENILEYYFSSVYFPGAKKYIYLSKGEKKQLYSSLKSLEIEHLISLDYIYRYLYRWHNYAKTNVFETFEGI